MKRLLSVRSSRFICYIDTKGNTSWCRFSLYSGHFAPTPRRSTHLHSTRRYHFYLLYKHRTKRNIQCFYEKILSEKFFINEFTS